MSLKTHCVHGHEFTTENTYIRQDMITPVRVCRRCVAARQLIRMRRVRAEPKKELASLSGT